MFRLSFTTIFRTFFFLFFIPVITVTAQETHLYNKLLKESLKPDFMRPDIPLEMDSSVNIAKIFNDTIFNDTIFNDIKKVNVLRMFFYYRIEFLLAEKNRVHFEDKIPKLSPGATQFFYTNSKNESWDSRKFNGDGSFSGEFAMKNTVLESRAAGAMVNVSGLISRLSSKTPKESKKAKTLKIIKKMYNIEN